jgi:hypothetical protein
MQTAQPMPARHSAGHDSLCAKPPAPSHTCATSPAHTTVPAGQAGAPVDPVVMPVVGTSPVSVVLELVEVVGAAAVESVLVVEAVVWTVVASVLAVSLGERHARGIANHNKNRDRLR